jgi:hypothetical protein
MKTFFMLLIAILFLQSVVFAQQKPPLKSLNIGNFWVYEYTSSKAPRPDITGDAYERVVGTRMINGKQYAQVYNSYFQTFFFERSDSNNVYFWNGSEEIRTHSLEWKVGDTINFQFLWHGCANCKYIITATFSSYVANILKDSIYRFVLRDVVPRNLMPVSPYSIAYVRRFFINQIDTSGLYRERPDGFGGSFLKGAFIDGRAIRDTNITTSVIDDPNLSLVQSKQGRTTIQSTAPRIAITMSAENPFTQRTQVRYRLEQAGTVELAVYSTQGVRLTSIQRGYQSAGEHTATWNGTNAEGLDVPTGAYFLVVFVNDKQAGEVKVIKQR